MPYLFFISNWITGAAVASRLPAKYSLQTPKASIEINTHYRTHAHTLTRMRTSKVSVRVFCMVSSRAPRRLLLHHLLLLPLRLVLHRLLRRLSIEGSRIGLTGLIGGEREGGFSDEPPTGGSRTRTVRRGFFAVPTLRTPRPGRYSLRSATRQ